MTEDDGGKISAQLRRRMIEANIHGDAERQRKWRSADVDKIAQLLSLVTDAEAHEWFACIHAQAEPGTERAVARTIADLRAARAARLSSLE